MTLWAVDDTETIFIPLADGRRLAARLWLPRGKGPSGTVLEYIPYRRRDVTRPRDEPIHHWLASHGHACIRVDMHGAGDSDGILRQEFQRQEQDDGLEVIAWIAAQPWCDGQVAMIGKSWGAYASLMTAARQPPALKGIVPVCGGDNRYDQSLHYTGGAMLVETVWWSDIMMIFNMRPPDPDVVGDRWEAMWRARLEAIEPWLAEWLHHQRRDHFWQHGSVSDDPGAIKCMVLATGGWADYICRTVPRLMGSLSVPRWGIVGPWGHHYPQDGIPGPRIGFLQEIDRFLRTAFGYDRSMEAAPRMRAWIGEWRRPEMMHGVQPGRFVAETEWPSPHIRGQVLHLNPGTLAPVAGPDTPLLYRGAQTVGLCFPEWLSQAVPGEAGQDQRADDGQSLCFDSVPVTERIEILGSTVLELEVTVDQPVAMIAARLCAVAPDGTSLMVVRGILNLTHRDGDEAPVAMTPGQRTKVRLVMPEVGYAFAPGERIRLALSTSCWPIVWPSPVPVTLTLHAGASRMILPERPPRADDAPVVFEAPESGPPTPITVLDPARFERRIVRDVMTGTHVLEMNGDGFLGPGRRFRFDATGMILSHGIRKRCTIHPDDPLTAAVEFIETMEFERGDWRVTLDTRTRLTSTATTFRLEAEAKARHDGQVVFERNWTTETPRDLA